MFLSNTNLHPDHCIRTDFTSPAAAALSHTPLTLRLSSTIHYALQTRKTQAAASLSFHYYSSRPHQTDPTSPQPQNASAQTPKPPLMVMKNGKFEIAKRFQCKECSKWFPCPDSLREHCEWEHPSADTLANIGGIQIDVISS
jgi:hypothetical protein